MVRVMRFILQVMSCSSRWGQPLCESWEPWVGVVEIFSSAAGGVTLSLGKCIAVG